MIRSMERSTITNGEWYKSMSAGFVAVGDYELIATEILTANTPSVTFSSLATHASTYKHLQIRLTARSTRAVGDTVGVRLNGVTTNSYSWHYLRGNGTAVSSAAGTSNSSIATFDFAGNDSAANVFGSGVIDILDSFSNSKNTTIRALGGYHGAERYIYLSSGALLSTDSITSVTLLSRNSQNFVAGSRFSLYGIR